MKTSSKNNVICFEPGIARREGSDSRFVQDMSVTLRAHMGDNQPAVCNEVDNGKDQDTEPVGRSE